MKDNDTKAVVKSQETPTASTNHHPNKVGKGKGGTGAKVPSGKRAAKAPTFSERTKLERDESVPAATSKPARKPAKTKAVAVKKVTPKTKKAKPESKSVKTAKVEEPKSEAVPVGPAAPKSGAKFSARTQKPPGPKQASPEMQAWRAAREQLPDGLPGSMIRSVLRSVIRNNPSLDETVWIGAVIEAVEAKGLSFVRGKRLSARDWIAAAKAITSGLEMAPGDDEGAHDSDTNVGANDRTCEKTGPPVAAVVVPATASPPAKPYGLADKIYGNVPKTAAPVPRPRAELRDLEPLDKVRAQFDALGLNYEETDTGYRSQCPNHLGSKLNFEVKAGDDGRVLVCCQAFHDDTGPGACTQQAVVEALGLEFTDLYPRRDHDDPEGRDHDEKFGGKDRAVTAEEYARWKKEAAAYAAALTREPLLRLVKRLGVASSALRSLHVGWKAENARYDKKAGKWVDDGPAWTFPERDAQGRVIGIQRRFVKPTLEKKAIAGSRRGLYLPDRWREMPGPVIIPEGASDVAALLSVGRCAVGRPNVRAGIDLLVELFGGDAREIVVAGENDCKLDGSWPGRAGAVRVSEALAERLGRPVKLFMPPPEFKDLREFLAANNTPNKEGQTDVN